MCRKCDENHRRSGDTYVSITPPELERLLALLREETNQTEEIVERNPFG